MACGNVNGGGAALGRRPFSFNHHRTSETSALSDRVNHDPVNPGPASGRCDDPMGRYEVRASNRQGVIRPDFVEIRSVFCALVWGEELRAVRIKERQAVPLATGIERHE